MRACFLLKDLTLAGGVSVVVQHAERIAAAQPNSEIAIVLTDPEAELSDSYRLNKVRVAQLGELAPDEIFDVAVATWWETAYDLFEVPARQYAYFVQSIEDRFYEPDMPLQRMAAQLTYDLPVTFVTEARWIQDFLGRIRPDANCFYVPNGIDKDVYSLAGDRRKRNGDEPLRIMVEGHPYVWFKGVSDAIDATRLTTEPVHTTLVAPREVRDWHFDVDRVLFSLSQAELAQVYAETDIVLKLSRVEGMFGPPLEGFHMGATCLVTPVTGHEEYVVHGHNGIVVDFDDLQGTARWLDLLARDRAYLRELQSRALQTAAEWPAWDQSANTMAQALDAIAALNPEAVVDGGRELARAMRFARAEIAYKHLETALVDLEHIKSRRAYKILDALGRMRRFAWSIPYKVIPLPARRVIGRMKRRAKRALRRSK